MSDARQTLAATLRNRKDAIPAMNVVSGFDGFVDQLIQVVEERKDLNTFDAVPTIARFADLMQQAAGRSSLREIVVNSTDAGGCAVNLGDGLVHLGVPLDYYGTVGIPRHPAFDEFAGKCRSMTSWGREPGMTLALEFNDGKYMLSSVTQLAEFTPDLLDEFLADGSFLEACQRADMITITNWTLYPHMTECWAKIQREVIRKLEHNPWIFIDLVDPRSRTKEDIAAMMDVLPGFENGGRCILGGNLNEANVLSEILGLLTVEEEGPEVAEQMARLRDTMGLSEVAIHCVVCAGVSSDDGTIWVDGPYTPSPVKSTGAGDRYNSGYCLGRALDLSAEERCLLGTACSGFFVRNARSGSVDEIAHLLDSWAAGTLKD